MQFTKDIILKDVRRIGDKAFAGLNIKNKQPVIVNLNNGKQNTSEILKSEQSNTIKFDRAQKIEGGGEYVEYNAGWASRVKTQESDRDMFIAAANIKLVAVTNAHGNKEYDDIRSTSDLEDALRGSQTKIQGFVTAIRSDLSEVVDCIQDAQRIAKMMINRSRSSSYTPKMIIRAINKATGDTAAADILFVRSSDQSVRSGIDIKETMNQIARNESLNQLLTSSSKERGVIVEVIPAVHINMSARSTSSLIDKKLMRRGRGGGLGVADWHFRTFADMGKDTFVPCVLNIGVSPTDSKFHFAKTLDSVGEVGEKWSLSDIPTKNWNQNELQKISEHESCFEKPKSSIAPGF